MDGKKILKDRISPADCQDYLSRRITPKQLAQRYGTTAAYIRLIMPPRHPKESLPTKRQLRQARKEFRDSVARKVDKQEISIKEAAAQCGCSIRTMFRHLESVRNA